MQQRQVVIRNAVFQLIRLEELAVVIAPVGAEGLSWSQAGPPAECPAALIPAICFKALQPDANQTALLLPCFVLSIIRGFLKFCRDLLFWEAALFQKTIVLNPLPTTSFTAAAQAAHFSAQVAQHGFTATQAGARSAIQATTRQDTPSENKRLHLLYSQVYTAEELDGLIAATFEQLSVGG